MEDNQDLSAQDNATPANADTADNAAATPADDLATQLAAAQAQAQEHYDAWLRAKAEMENLRRRAQEDVSKAAKFAIEKFANELLVVKDSLEQTLTVEGASTESLREGVELTLKNLDKAFEKSSLMALNPTGEKFDPHKHQAISQIPSEQPANTVVQVFQKGYSLEGRVLRPALVAVSSGNAS